MNQYGLKFHHFGLATREEKESLRFLKKLNYVIGKTTFDPEQLVNLTFCSHETEPSVEVVSKAVDDGPLDSILENKNASVYHLCYTCDSLELTLSAMREDGLRVIEISKNKPAIIFDGKLVSFYFIKNFGLVEFINVT
jgi:methylmalonyl-CoA/ethylmalonyl-CoA epimerase